MSFNPCFSGTYSRTGPAGPQINRTGLVSILVLVELTLEREEQNRSRGGAGVSILVLVELTLELFSDLLTRASFRFQSLF